MPHSSFVAGLLVLTLLAGPPTDRGHEQNDLLREVLAQRLPGASGGAILPKPVFEDGQSADDQEGALERIAGSKAKAAELLRDSVTAPHILQLHDADLGKSTLRSGSCWFIIHADLDPIEPSKLLAGRSTGEVEAGNMRFEAAILSDDDRKRESLGTPGEQEWFVHSKGRLLDRVAVESTSRIVASRSKESLVLASRTDPRFNTSSRWPNRWSTLSKERQQEAAGPAQPFDGGLGYVIITRLKAHSGALVVECHFTFSEPRDWFQGAPILRSKLGLIAQDQIRQLRRELKKADK